MDWHFDGRALAETRLQISAAAETMRLGREIRDVAVAAMFAPPAPPARTVSGAQGRPPPRNRAAHFCVRHCSPHCGRNAPGGQRRARLAELPAGRRPPPPLPCTPRPRGAGRAAHTG